MKNRVASVIFLLTSISVALGAFGHGHQWAKRALPALGSADRGLVRLLELVWYWVSGAMFVFGCLLVWSWWRIPRGERAPHGEGRRYFPCSGMVCVMAP